ncbi:unnamed protein product [Onchocerca flexuosa]|uniref:Uncharacterized protein n=1 Tax=Onchocerca flexuosa TaxID=387005 RepID=A0A183HFC4_9BILA|nr:unnamed protein product [Onchocerca flexuosa]
MSESRASSASPPTILRITSDLPLDDPKSVPTTETKLIKISNSLQNPESSLAINENLCSKSDDATPGSILKKESVEKVGFLEDQKSSDVDAQKSAEKVRNANENEVHLTAFHQTSIEKSDEVGNEGAEKTVISESFKTDEPTDRVTARTVDDAGAEKDNNEVWMTPENTPVMPNIEIKTENDGEVCAKNSESTEEGRQTSLRNTADERHIQGNFQGANTNISNEKLSVLSDKNFEDDHKLRKIDNTERMTRSENLDFTNDHLESYASLEFRSNSTVSKSPDHRSTGTVSESPPGATDSWKNATINMNPSHDDGTQGGIQSAYNTTSRNDQTKIIYNNTTLSELILMN